MELPGAATEGKIRSFRGAWKNRSPGRLEVGKKSYEVKMESPLGIMNIAAGTREYEMQFLVRWYTGCYVEDQELKEFGRRVLQIGVF